MVCRLACLWGGAGVHDVVLAEDTLVGVVVRRPKREGFDVWAFEVDKGY